MSKRFLLVQTPVKRAYRAGNRTDRLGRYRGLEILTLEGQIVTEEECDPTTDQILPVSEKLKPGPGFSCRLRTTLDGFPKLNTAGTWTHFKAEWARDEFLAKEIRRLL